MYNIYTENKTLKKCTKGSKRGWQYFRTKTNANRKAKGALVDKKKMV